MKTKNKVKYFLITALAVTSAVLFAACEENFIFPERPIPPGEEFIPVESITGIPTKLLPYAEVNLSNSVKLTPSNATNRRIVWSITGAVGTEAALTNGRWLSVTEEGTVTVTATITNGASQDTDFVESFVVVVTTEP